MVRLRPSRKVRRHPPPRSRQQSPAPRRPLPRLPPRRPPPWWLLRLPLLRPPSPLQPRHPPRPRPVCLGLPLVRWRLPRGRLPRGRLLQRRLRQRRPVPKHLPPRLLRHVKVALIPRAPRPVPARRAPGTTPLRRARACLEVAAKAASLGRAAKHRRLHVQATTPSLPARECPAHRVAVRLLPVPAVPALVPRARTRA